MSSYVVRYDVPWGLIDRTPYRVEADDDRTAIDKARIEAERRRRDGTVTWSLRTADGRRVR